jgi:hypothetical protein
VPATAPPNGGAYLVNCSAGFRLQVFNLVVVSGFFGLDWSSHACDSGCL